jgi:hypothetical protein
VRDENLASSGTIEVSEERSGSRLVFRDRERAGRVRRVFLQISGQCRNLAKAGQGPQRRDTGRDVLHGSAPYREFNLGRVVASKNTAQLA